MAVEDPSAIVKHVATVTATAAFAANAATPNAVNFFGLGFPINDDSNQ